MEAGLAIAYCSSEDLEILVMPLIVRRNSPWCEELGGHLVAENLSPRGQYFIETLQAISTVYLTYLDTTLQQDGILARELAIECQVSHVNTKRQRLADPTWPEEYVWEVRQCQPSPGTEIRRLVALAWPLYRPSHWATAPFFCRMAYLIAQSSSALIALTRTRPKFPNTHKYTFCRA